MDITEMKSIERLKRQVREHESVQRKLMSPDSRPLSLFERVLLFLSFLLNAVLPLPPRHPVGHALSLEAGLCAHLASQSHANPHFLACVPFWTASRTEGEKRNPGIKASSLRRHHTHT
ncbi:uncharacterized protein LAESUDRAFT_339426 [Laetiporus sulphureus 93-53]|uniref:Uncharacterized protein n=1 Tax=Laetiporus sulphureus 93-53 TaxID=1314785 RepID=A0A165GNF6_9APHY|nr:uncharacterized protein LAESUDRAFT_339426 [Laetiporus sulphureus 93-53]KZT10589.1 hypothetical protein LAESUDRAFT_339426 [Laetiporus sulphureus 93-53]